MDETEIAPAGMRACKDCGDHWFLTESARTFFVQRHLRIPVRCHRCRACRRRRREAAEQQGEPISTRG